MRLRQTNPATNDDNQEDSGNGHTYQDEHPFLKNNKTSAELSTLAKTRNYLLLIPYLGLASDACFAIPTFLLINASCNTTGLDHSATRLR